MLETGLCFVVAFVVAESTVTALFWQESQGLAVLVQLTNF